MANDRKDAGTATSLLPKILTFHRLSTDFTWSANNYSPKRMASLLTRIESAGFLFVPLSEAEQRTAAGEKCVAITFDDGMAELAQVLPPLIDRFGLRPTVFVPTAFVGQPNRWDYSYRLAPSRHLSEDEIRRLASIGVEFGSHGHIHQCLRGMAPGQAVHELCRSRTFLEDLLGQSVKAISYPFGRFDGALLSLADQAGFERGYSMKYPAEGDHRLALGRMAVYTFDSESAVARKLRGAGVGYRIEKHLAATVNRLAGGTVLLQRFRSSHM